MKRFRIAACIGLAVPAFAASISQNLAVGVTEASAASVTQNLAINVTAPVTGTILPPDRDASANWRMAGMLSAGGIPNRTAVCATINPRGSGQDDTTNIQNAIGACPLGQVVSLAAGTFTIAEGSY